MDSICFESERHRYIVEKKNEIHGKSQTRPRPSRRGRDLRGLRECGPQKHPRADPEAEMTIDIAAATMLSRATLANAVAMGGFKAMPIHP